MLLGLRLPSLSVTVSVKRKNFPQLTQIKERSDRLELMMLVGMLTGHPLLHGPSVWWGGQVDRIVHGDCYGSTHIFQGNEVVVIGSGFRPIPLVLVWVVLQFLSLLGLLRLGFKAHFLSLTRPSSVHVRGITSWGCGCVWGLLEGGELMVVSVLLYW